MACEKCEKGRQFGFNFCPNCGEDLTLNGLFAQIEVTEKPVSQTEVYETPVATSYQQETPEAPSINTYTQQSNYIPQQPSYQNQSYQQNYYQPPQYQQNYNPYQQQYPYQSQYQYQIQQNQNSKRVGVIPLLGFIFSLLGFYFAIAGLILGIIGINKLKTYNPIVYNVKLNKVFSIFATAFSAGTIVFYILIIASSGS